MRASRFTLSAGTAADVRALPERPPDISDTVAGILADVRERGDEAVLELTRRFDGEVKRARVMPDDLDG